LDGDLTGAARPVRREVDGVPDLARPALAELAVEAVVGDEPLARQPCQPALDERRPLAGCPPDQPHEEQEPEAARPPRPEPRRAEGKGEGRLGGGAARRRGADAEGVTAGREAGVAR